MKNLLIILTATFIILNGCEKGLDPQLYGTLSPTTFPSNEYEYELYTVELYKLFLGSWGYQEPETDWTNSFFSPERGHIVMLDMPSDIFTAFTQWGSFWEGQSTCNFDYMLNEDSYQSHFDKVRFVTRATKIIGDLENSDILDHVKTRLIGEARMARGWIMWFLLYYYGPVPVILDYEKVGDEDAESDLTRPTREFFVNSIAADLRSAADNLEVVPAEYGRFNKGLALTVLMRLYMNEKDFSNAESVGREIQALGYSLVDNYASLFREATEQNSETIWAVSCSPEQDETENFNPLGYYCYPDDYSGDVISAGWGDGVFMVTWDFYDSYDTLDERRLFITEYTRNPVTVRAGEDAIRSRTSKPPMRGALIQKYLDEGESGNFRGNDYILARYADVMLLLAEAINNNNGGPTAEAIGLVNEVRARAGIGELPAEDIANQQAFNNAILRERGWELYLEGFRKLDIIRHGKWPSILGIVPGKNTSAPPLCPIPTYAINNSEGKLEQNPGYD
jgi:hypothetical protein